VNKNTGNQILIREIRALHKRAIYILQTEGLKTLFIKGFKSGFYERQTYLLYEHLLQDRNEDDFRPDLKDFVFIVVSTINEVDKLISDGFNFHSSITKIRDRLDKGAEASCIFVGKELSSIGFIARNQEAMESLDQPPYKVNFSAGEVCTGGLWTNPKHRGLGLAAYNYFKRLQLLKNEGKIIARNVVYKNNDASHKMLARFSPIVRAEGCSLRILWHVFWKEKLL
jgi:hypothetical protein